MRTTDRRVVATGAVVAGVLWIGTGTATAGPPAGRGDLFPTEGVAYASLPAPDGSLFVHLSVFGVPGEEATAGVEVFGTHPEHGPYECFEGPPIAASLAGLAGAEAAGSTTLLCGGEDLPDDVVASVTVDVEWTAYGRVDRSAVVMPEEPCVALTRQRAADVDGLATVSIPALGATAEMTQGFGDVRTLTSICAGGRG